MIVRVALLGLALASAVTAVSIKRDTQEKAHEARSDYSAPSYGGGGGGGAAASAHGAPPSQGNLYYYYYPVEEHAGYPTTAGGDDFSALLALLLPLLLLGGLALLFVPLFSGGIVINTGGNATGRKKRDQDTGEPELEFVDTMADLRSEVNRLFFVYLNAVESEQCPERIFCEVGTYAGGVSGKDFLFRMIDTLNIIPDAFKSRFRVMEKAALTGKDYSVCKKYLCHPPKIVKRN